MTVGQGTRVDYTITFDEELNAVVLLTRGPMQVDQFAKMIVNITAALRQEETANILADHRESLSTELSTQNVKELSQLAQGLSEVLNGKRFAVVMRAKVDYGLGRMWQILTEDDVPFEIMIFRDESKARAWL